VRFARPLLLLLALLAFPQACCKRPDDDGTRPQATALPPLVLRDDTPDLLLIWIDDHGDGHNAQHAADIPEASRSAVRVIVTTRDEGATSDLVYVADLSKKQPDGSYAVSSLKRSAWEALAEQRRQGHLAPLTPPAPSGGAPTPRHDEPAPPTSSLGQSRVIIYGASWCGPCHEAEAHLKQRGVPVEMHDIEREPAAQQEMQRKLAQAGERGGSIPVIDVNGRIFVGYNPAAIDAALRDALRRQTPL
jgi:glutaredoxin